ncbi:hypothetical protein [Actinophytocola algeriensis]|uniref:Uncharacterized protein n=1 Tax=Actinophytocola algeriensis TaxID=1768010 RepID=A0A7W7Q3S6_9PSEU|nr:hypothetical protein [Actinophytocola algeriensis]MBB4906414.1 hypothetical protein [Actinophytocola algeriensis]MBE1477895.1 hypothetical protein [Actinophytocola algeriensis]
MSELVFPVGHYVGERHPEGVQVVRVGVEHRPLTADEFGVWVLAHGAPEDGAVWTTDDLLRLAEETELADAGRHVEELTAKGLLALVPAEGGPEAVAFVEKYRLAPLLVGLGNTEDDPDDYALGFPLLDEPVAVVPVGSYELWQWGHVAPSMWHTCEVRAKVAADLNEPSGSEEVLAGLLADLRPLLVNSCAYLDLASR